MRAILALSLLLTGCATAPHREPSHEVLDHKCVNGGVLIRVEVQADDPAVLTLAVPDGLCGEPA